MKKQKQQQPFTGIAIGRVGDTSAVYYIRDDGDGLKAKQIFDVTLIQRHLVGQVRHGVSVFLIAGLPFSSFRTNDEEIRPKTLQGVGWRPFREGGDTSKLEVLRVEIDMESGKSSLKRIDEPMEIVAAINTVKLQFVELTTTPEQRDYLFGAFQAAF